MGGWILTWMEEDTSQPDIAVPPVWEWLVAEDAGALRRVTAGAAVGIENGQAHCLAHVPGGVVNGQQLSTINSFDLTGNESNLPPVLGVRTDRRVNACETLSFTASDPDLPANALTFSLPRGEGRDEGGRWRCYCSSCSERTQPL